MGISLVAGVTTLGCVTGVVVTWLQLRHRRAASIGNVEVMHRLDEISDRLARVDGSIDTMAVEVERISEAQRFTARVLAERNATPAIPEPRRPLGSTTPH